MIYKDYADQRERSARKAAQDKHLRGLEREFDLSAKDNHMKYERPSFVVVTASEAYRDGWDRTFRNDQPEGALESGPDDSEEGSR